MKIVRDLILVLIVVCLGFSGCSFQMAEAPQEPITGLDDGSVKVIREDVGPSSGGILNLFMVTPQTFNPLTTTNLYVRQLSTFVFDTLFYKDEQGNMKNGIVDSFSFDQDGLILDIKLKEKILFHDGTTLSSDDVAFTLESINRAGTDSIYSQNISNIKSINTLTRTKLRVIMNHPDTEIINSLTFPILPKHVFKDWPIKGHNDSMKLIGSGPFMFNSYDDTSINLIRNESWWFVDEEGGLNHPIWLDGITFKIYPNESDMMQAFQRQQIDIAWLEEGEINSYSKRADIFFNKYLSNILEFLILSPSGEKNSPLQQDDFRNIIIKYLRSYVLDNPFEQGMLTNHIEPNRKSMDSLSKIGAINALEEIGFNYDVKENFLYILKNRYKSQVTISLIYNGLNTDREKLSIWLTEALAQIGIVVKAKSATYEEQYDLIENQRFDMMLLGCRIPLHGNEDETLELLSYNLNLRDEDHVVLPLYRKYGAVLYHNYIRGDRSPVWDNIYNGWHHWYIVPSQNYTSNYKQIEENK